MAALLSSGGIAGAQCELTGPADLVIARIDSVMRYGSMDGLTAFSLGTTFSNHGAEPADWTAATNDHPVVVANLYRLRDGALKQIGSSWATHGSSVISTLLDCPSCDPAPSFTALGSGCSSPQSSSYNGGQSSLGPRSVIDPLTGSFPFPHAAPPVQNLLSRRLQVQTADLNPSLNPDSRYFVEVQVICADDAVGGNGDDNVSWREVTIVPQSGGWTLLLAGQTQVGESVAHAWQQWADGVTIAVHDDPGVGRVVVAARVSPVGASWRYEYTVHNLSVARSIGSVAVPKSNNAQIIDLAFHGAPQHSGEPFESAPWTSAVSAGEVSWSTASFDRNPQAFALRWGMLDTFAFTSDAGPAPVSIRLGLFASGSPAEIFLPLPGPAQLCPADLDGNGAVDFLDALAVLAAWGPCGICEADIDQSGDVGFGDLLALLAAWGECD